MLIRHYRLLTAVAASLSFVLSGCGSAPPKPPVAAAAPHAPVAKVATNTPRGGLDTDATIWTLLGLAKEHPNREPGPRTGPNVNPILWQAAHDTLDFVKIASQDPQTGVMITNWYSPPGKSNERFKVNVLILSRILRSDAVLVTVRHQETSADGRWLDVTGDAKIASALDSAILSRARVLRHKWFPHAAANQ